MVRISSENSKAGKRAQELPTVDWHDLQHNRQKFLNDLRVALSDFGFLVLTNAPGPGRSIPTTSISRSAGLFRRAHGRQKDGAYF